MIPGLTIIPPNPPRQMGGFNPLHVFILMGEMEAIFGFLPGIN